MADEYLLIVHPKDGREYAVTEKGFGVAEYKEKGFKVDRWQDGVEYTGDLPKLTNKERENLGRPTPTKEKDLIPEEPVAKDEPAVTVATPKGD